MNDISQTMNYQQLIYKQSIGSSMDDSSKGRKSSITPLPLNQIYGFGCVLPRVLFCAIQAQDSEKDAYASICLSTTVTTR